METASFSCECLTVIQSSTALSRVLCSSELRSVLFCRAFRLLKNHQDAEDAVQETLLRVCRRERLYHANKSPWPWLFAIGRNACLDALRAKERDRLVLQQEAGNRIPPACETALENVRRQQIHRSLLALPAMYKSLVAYHDIFGYSKREIAQNYGIPYHTVRTRLRRGRRMLASLLNEHE